MINIRFTLHCLLLSIIMIGGLAIPHTAYAQAKNRQDSTLIAIRLYELNERKADIQKKIQVEDSKRNQSIEGVSYETQEKLNFTQDSICMELRSQLTDIELEIGELKPVIQPTRIIQQYNRLRQSQANKPPKKENGASHGK